MNSDRVVRALLAVGTTLLAVILAVNLWFLAASRTGTLSDRIERIEDQLQFVTCLLLVEEPQHSPEAVASCQVASDD